MKNKLIKTTNIGHLILRIEFLYFNQEINDKLSELFQCISLNKCIVELTLKLRIASNWNEKTVDFFNNKENKQWISSSIQSSIIHCIANKQISHNFVPTKNKRCYINDDEMEFTGNEFELRIDAHNADPYFQHNLIFIDDGFLYKLCAAINNNDCISMYSLYLNECNEYKEYPIIM